jgi:membrane protein implicated in regulation of membrane protease activity
MNMPTWLRYLLFQIPGWVMTAVVLAGLWHWQVLTVTLAVIAFSAWLLKDLILYPLLRQAYEPGAETGSAALVGERGVTQGVLNPSGHIRVRGELWRADAVPQDQIIASGAKVEIVNSDGMKLFVRAALENRGDDGS